MLVSSFLKSSPPWRIKLENEAAERFYYFLGEQIKFRIVSEMFMETSPDVKTSENKSIPENKVPYLLYVSMLLFNFILRYSEELFIFRSSYRVASMNQD